MIDILDPAQRSKLDQLVRAAEAKKGGLVTVQADLVLELAGIVEAANAASQKSSTRRMKEPPQAPAASTVALVRDEMAPDAPDSTLDSEPGDTIS